MPKYYLPLRALRRRSRQGDRKRSRGWANGEEWAETARKVIREVLFRKIRGLLTTIYGVVHLALDTRGKLVKCREGGKKRGRPFRMNWKATRKINDNAARTFGEERGPFRLSDAGKDIGGEKRKGVGWKFSKGRQRQSCGKQLEDISNWKGRKQQRAII